MLEPRTGGDIGLSGKGSPGPWSALEWSSVLLVLVAIAILCIMVGRLTGSASFGWLPLGMSAALVLRYGIAMAIPGGIVAAASGPWLVGAPTAMSWSTPPDPWVLVFSSIGLGIATTIALIAFRAAMGSAAHRITHGRVTLGDAGRLVGVGMPLTTAVTTLAWCLVDVGNGGLNSDGDSKAWAAFAASQMLGLLAGLPLSVSLLPSEGNRITYRCRAVRIRRVAPGMALLLATVVASWWIPSGAGEGVRTVFLLIVMAAFLWLATHSGWLSASIAALVVSFSNTQDAFGGLLPLVPLLSFVILLTASMEQRFRDLARMNDQFEELQALIHATGAAFFQVDLRKTGYRKALETADQLRSGCLRVLRATQRLLISL